MSGISVQGHKAAAFSNGGMQAALVTKVDAKLSQEVTKTAGLLNLKSGNDFTVELAVKKPDGTTGKVFITPDDLATLKDVAKGTKSVEEKSGSSDPITVYENGASIGTIDPATVLSK